MNIISDSFTGRRGKKRTHARTPVQIEVEEEVGADPEINFAVVNNPLHSVIKGVNFFLGDTNVRIWNYLAICLIKTIFGLN